KTAVEPTARLPFIVDLFSLRSEAASESPSDARLLSLPVAVAGVLDRAGRIDYYRFEATAGQEVGVQSIASSSAKLEPVLVLSAEDGQVVAESENGLLGYTCEKAGRYLLRVRDREYRGGPEMQYRLQLGNVPIVTGIFPMGIQRGNEAEIHVDG